MSLNPLYKKLYQRLGYQFLDADNLTLALTHRSYKNVHNERLEYLGDAVLGLVVAEELFKRFPKQPEGKLTRMRATLVKGETLAEVGREFELGDVLLLGSGELKSGGYRRSSILADAVEAIIGAIYLESGLDCCKQLILNWFDSRFSDLDPTAHPKDNKTQLQEFLQGRKLPLPEYEVLEVLGKDHDQIFVVTCSVEGLSEKIAGRGSSRRKAEQHAAQQVLEKLK
ncbi:ribonuclease III [Aliiglaciecola sp. 3_MG-2023]|uniref:ribonuclease III n=1 Tax=Aliiglaciecola sp. 3_MG-2023 TaxID=3062644 RepID=UPI0026E2BB31|nr:ribonuclease III [Aliiglaciecola sp. 3_MG-2023]MDO6691833.1 ribonuclease III [Aliiglaciecola sp. 3_MG-2023]